MDQHGPNLNFQGLGLDIYFSKLVLLAIVGGWAVKLTGLVLNQHGLKLEFEGLGLDLYVSNLVFLAIAWVWAVALAGPVLDQHGPDLISKIRASTSIFPSWSS